MIRLRDLLVWLADVTLGPRCPTCTARVFPADQPNHPKDCT